MQAIDILSPSRKKAPEGAIFMPGFFPARNKACNNPAQGIYLRFEKEGRLKKYYDEI